jgi:hypothetical protein
MVRRSGFYRISKALAVHGGMARGRIATNLSCLCQKRGTPSATLISMRCRWNLLIICTLIGSSCARRLSLPKGVSWDEKSATFGWWSGEVKLPAGYNYHVDQGADSFEGHFTSPDGKLVIRHDIGGYAGAWAGRRNDASFFEERIEEGSRVWVTRRSWPDGRGGRSLTLMAVTFPDVGCANFFLTSSKVEDFEPIAQVARSFRPKTHTKSTSGCR